MDVIDTRGTLHRVAVDANTGRLAQAATPGEDRPHADDHATGTRRHADERSPEPTTTDA
ncbi:hypothetical protein QFZ74_000710 [Streptomyces sp. V3I7]|nr:hypothetical protein [Streptomyces sp. V3I7]MDQ0989482.1 hypothetical protein [Streptomyces sp. V3I7]